MALLPNISAYNNERKELVKFKTLNDEIILLSRGEAIEALVKYISEELDLFTNDLGICAKKELKANLVVKIKEIENAMIKHVDDKINKITERIVAEALDKRIDEEVDKRVEEKLKKIKDSL